MAAAIVSQPKPGGGAEDDEEWLYGDAGNAENKEPAAPGTVPLSQLPPPKEKEEGEMSGDEQQNQTQEKYAEEDSDDEDDDDDVQVTIGDIKAFPMNTSGTNLFKPGGTYQKQPVTGQKVTSTNPAAKGVDVDTEGNINGVNVFEFSLDSLRDEEKPWRKPGADITDYFNYGFNEESWRKYCQKQNRLRAENGVAIPRAFASMGTGSTSGSVVRVDTGESSMGVIQSRPIQKSTYTPHQTSGTIAVLGSTAASRRPAEEQLNDVEQIGSISSNNVLKTPMSVLPPGVPPMGVPPPDYSMPPPGMPSLPPNFPPVGVPPPGMGVPPPMPHMFNPPPTVPPFYPPHVPPPQDGRGGFSGERPPFSYDTTSPNTSYTTTGAKSSWESRDTSRDSYRERDRERDRYDYKQRDRSPEDYSGRDYYRDRGRDSERRDRDRSRSRSRERDRRHRDRDSDKKSKRKIKDEPDDADYYKSSSSSSKHKKSKRSKRDKDDESEDATGS